MRPLVSQVDLNTRCGYLVVRALGAYRKEGTFLWDLEEKILWAISSGDRVKVSLLGD